MATVQRVVGPSVQQDVLPSARVTANLDSNYANGTVRGLQQLGGVVGQIQEQEQAKADTASVLEARRKLSDWERSWFDPNNPEGVYAKKGRDALGLEDQVAPDFDRVSAELMGGLRSEKARQTFQAMALGQRDSVLGRVQSHAVREHEGYVQAEGKAAILNATEMAARAALEGRYGDQSVEADLGLKTIRSMGVLNGEPAEATRLKEQEFLSAVHATAINGMLGKGDIEEAIKYFDANLDDLSATAEGEIRGRMNPLMLESMADKVEESVTTGGAMPVGSLPMQGAATTEREAEAIAVASVGRTIKLESGGKADAKNPRSTATGAGQFLEGTWMTTVGKYAPHLTQGRSRAEVLELRKDPQLSNVMAQAYSKENARFLFQSGLPVTQETVYMAYRFGPGGAAKILRAPADTPIKSLVSGQVMAANPDLKGKTVASLSASHDQRAGGQGSVDSTAVVRSGPVTVAAVPHAAPGPVLVPTGQTAAQAMRQRAQATPNILLRKKLETRADQMEAEADRARRDFERGMTDAIWEKVGAAPATATARAILSPEELVFATNNKMLGTIEGEQLRKAKGDLVHDNLKLVQQLDIEAIDNPSGFKKRVISQYSDQLTPETRSRLLKMQADVDKPEKRQDWANDQARVRSMAVALGYDKITGEQAKAKGGELAQAWRLAKEAYIQRTGKPPTHEEGDKLAQAVKRQFLEDPQQGAKVREAVKASASPADYRRVRESLQRRYGKVPTDAQVQAIMAAMYREQAPDDAD